jgi:hypothetical protein
MLPLRQLLSFSLASLLLGFLLGLYLPSCSEKKGSAELTAVKDIPKTEVKMDEKATVKGLNEDVLLEKKIISKDIAKDDNREVTAAAVLKDDSGTTNITSVINPHTGESEIVAKRSVVEWMSRNELGVGVTGGTLGLGEELEYRRVFARVWKFYPDLRINVWRWESGPRLDDDHRYDAQISALATLRW